MNAHIHNREEETDTSSIAPIGRMERKAKRLRALLKMGGTLENQGNTLHIVGLRIDVRSIADMDEAVWRRAARSIIEMLGVDRRNAVANGSPTLSV